MEDGDTEKYQVNSLIQGFVFSSRKMGCIMCISSQVYKKKSFSHNVTSGSDIIPRNKFYKPLVVYIFGNVMQ